MITIKLINSLGSSFKIYLTILSQKTRDKNKLLNLSSFLSNLEDEKRCMKQTTKVNLVQSQNTSIGSTSLRGGSSSCAQVSLGDCEQSHLGRGDSGTTGGTSGAMGTGRQYSSSSSSNQNNLRCNTYNYYHIPELYPYVNLEWHVCGEKGHIHRNCPRKSQFSRQQG